LETFDWLILAVLALLPGAGSAAYPERPITMIVAYRRAEAPTWSGGRSRLTSRNTSAAARRS